MGQAEIVFQHVVLRIERLNVNDLPARRPWDTGFQPWDLCSIRAVGVANLRIAESCGRPGIPRMVGMSSRNRRRRCPPQPDSICPEDRRRSYGKLRPTFCTGESVPVHEEARSRMAHRGSLGSVHMRILLLQRGRANASRFFPPPESFAPRGPAVRRDPL